MNERPLRLYSPVNLDRKQVDNLLVTCSDHRFWHAFQNLAEDQDVEQADRIVYPAPSENIANGVLMPAIEKLQSLHNFSTISIYDHMHCGGTDYEGAEIDDDMLTVHKRKQIAAIKAVHQVLPEITVVTCVVGVEEIISTSESRLSSYV